MQGVALNNQEQKLLKNNKYAERILKELNPKQGTNISDIPDWVKSIGMSVVNSRLYNLANAQAETTENENASTNIDGQASVGYNNGTNVNQNDNGGIGNGAQAFDQRGYNETRNRGNQNYSGTAAESKDSWTEDKAEFIRRAKEYRRDGKQKVIVDTEKAVFAYVPAEADNSVAYKAVRFLQGLGIDAIYCDGGMESNSKGKTETHPEAVTGPDGKVYINKHSSLSAIALAVHEGTHHFDRKGSPEYKKYKSVIENNLNVSSEAFIEIAVLINKENFDSKYDIDDEAFYPEFIRELTAYVNEYITADYDMAVEKFAPMFTDWDAVVEASKKFNEAIGLDFTDNDGNGGNSSGGDGSSLDASAKDLDIEFLKAPTSGRVLDMKPVSKQAQEYVIEIGKKLGRTVKFVDMEAELLKRGKDLSKFKRLPSAFYDTKTSEIYIGYQTDRPVQFLLKHEFTHFIQTKSGKYFDFQNKVFDSSAFKKWLKDKGYNNLR